MREAHAAAESKDPYSLSNVRPGILAVIRTNRPTYYCPDSLATTFSCYGIIPTIKLERKPQFPIQLLRFLRDDPGIPLITSEIPLNAIETIPTTD